MRFWTLSWHTGSAWRAQAMEALKSSVKALLLLGKAQNPTAMTCGITTRHSPASNNVTRQLQVCQHTKWCLSNASQVFWYRPPRAGHHITPGRSTNRTFLPQSALEHISISRAPTPRLKHLRSAPLMMVWFSAAEFFYQWKDKGYPMVKIQKDQRKSMIHQKHWLWFHFSADQVYHTGL